MWEIDRDYISDAGSKRTGTTGETINVGLGIIAPEVITLPGGPIVRFHMRDDDGILCYAGWLHNDPECLNQQAALEFGLTDAGCTTIEVQVSKGKWVQEIG